MFKNLIGRGHPEFSGKQQQDAQVKLKIFKTMLKLFNLTAVLPQFLTMEFVFQEFYLHLLTVMERENKRIGNANHAFHSLQFKVEDRLECGSSKQVILAHN